MNQLLSIPRLMQLIRKQWGDNRRFYLMGLLIVIGVLALIYFFNIYMSWDMNHTMQPYGLRLVLYYCGLYLAGCIFASAQFTELGVRQRAISQLLLPASQFEKLLTALLYGVVFFFICYHLLFTLLDYAGIALAKEVTQTASYKKHNVAPFADPGILNVFDGSTSNKYTLLAYFTLQSFFLLGSVYFEKFQFIKTTAALLVACALVGFYNYKLGSWFMPNGGIHIHEAFTELTLQKPDGSPGKTIAIPAVFRFLLHNGLFILLPVAWVATYFRLKEKEV